MTEWAGKRIVLFSDGTGNSAGKLFKTNVWRLYEALDLGPATPARPNVQIAYYDSGVGNSSFRPLALLGGIFGFGLKRNLLDIYKYLCRNYRPGDRIYVFGFSRGAFTIRRLVALIVRQGIVQYTDEKQLAYAVRDAYREMCRASWPNRWPARQIARLLRWLRDGVLFAKRTLLGQTPYAAIGKHFAGVEFVGVWDTVAAYGGPIIEITRGIDDWIWPLTLPNYELSPKVRKARHALSIDDARDSFQPLLWDEVRELDVIAQGRTVTVEGPDGMPVRTTLKAEPGRLEQVWFAGTHADVGGGYPDESLSYVSLAWMMGEADLAYLDQFHQRITTMANAFGPIHDSRDGLNGYYRFQPRKIQAALDWRHDPAHPPSHRDWSLRDPEVARDGYGEHGLLTEAKLHKSVLARIAHGTDGYAPINLPRSFVVYPTEPSEHPKEGSAAITAAHEGLVAEIAPPLPAPDDGARPANTAAVELGGSAAGWSRIWDLVWYRRVVYFLTVVPAVALATMPWWVSDTGLLQVCEDARCWGRSAVSLLDTVLPSFATRWSAAFSANLGMSGTLLAALLALIAVGTRLEMAMRGAARRLLTGNEGDAPEPGLLCRVRESRRYQRFVRAFRWYLAPFAAAMVCLLALALFALSILAQVTGTLREQPIGQHWRPICPRGAEGADPDQVHAERAFDPAAMCTPTPWHVVKGRRYVLTMRLKPTAIGRGKAVYGWIDRGLPTTPDGSIVHGFEPAFYQLAYYRPLFAGMRRVVLGGWLQTLVAVAPPSGEKGPPIFIDTLTLVKTTTRGVYDGEFTAQRTGNVAVFLNDAMMPITLTTFYNNNRGAACLSLRSRDTPPRRLPGAGAECGETSEMQPEHAAESSDRKMPVPDQ